MIDSNQNGCNLTFAWCAPTLSTSSFTPPIEFLGQWAVKDGILKRLKFVCNQQDKMTLFAVIC